MGARVPNLELLVYKTMEVLNRMDEYKRRLADCRKTAPRCQPEYALTTFTQKWPTTALGFDGVGQKKETEAYTTVVHERLTDIYLIFFGDNRAYGVINPTEVFFEDIKNHTMASKVDSRKY